MTLSGGLVLINEGESLDMAIRRADVLLYQAKQQGRNRIVSDLSVPAASNQQTPAAPG